MHDEGIVDGDAIDLVHARRLEVVVKPFESRTLLVRAGRGEGAREREDGNALAGEQIPGLDILPAEGIGTFHALVTHTRLEGDVGNFTSEHELLLGLAWEISGTVRFG